MELRRRRGVPQVGSVLTSLLIFSSAVALAQAPPGPQQPQQPNLIDNGEFTLRAADGSPQGWQRGAFSADAKIEVTAGEGGQGAVRLVGTTKRSKASIETPIKPFEGEVLRLTLRYRADKGKQSVTVRREAAEQGGKPTDQAFTLEPSLQWKAFETVVNLPAAEEAGEGKLLLVLTHEGPGETWFAAVYLAAGTPQPEAAQPGAATAPSGPGPYATGFFPPDGAVVAVNPPRLRWPGRPGAAYHVEWSPSPDFPPEATKSATGVALNVFVLPEALSPGAWYWRVTESFAGPPATPGPAPTGEQAEGAAPGETAPEGTTPPAAPPERKRRGKRPPKSEPPAAPTQPAAPETKEAPTPPETPAPEPPPTPAAPDATEPPAAPPAEGVAPEQPPPAAPPPAETPPKKQRGARSRDSGGEPLGLSPRLGPGRGRAPAGPAPPTGPAQPEPPREMQQNVSPTRHFRIGESATQAPAPPVETILTALPAHPRVWVTADSLLSLRALCEGALKPQWEGLRARLDEAKGKELPAEPKGKGRWTKPSAKDLQANEEILKVAAQEAGLVRDFALAALIGGEAPYADEARRRALNLAGWAPDGATGYASHDQAFREVLLALALAADWLPQSFSAEEKATLTKALSTRGEALLKALSQGPRPLNQFPYSSHGQTNLGFLAVAGLAAAGDVPEAQGWLRFAIPAAVGLFSPWAGDDGGWMQGEYYWKLSALYTFQLFDALRTAAGIDLYALPWTQSTARYKVYLHPPYSTRGGFGDGPERPPDARDRLAMWRLASARHDPLAAWYAQSVAAPEAPPTAFDLLWRDPSVQPQPPDKLPPSASFPDTGLFALHSSPADPQGLHLYGRASPFGSFNHAHADQSSFRLDAFGEPLLIDAGYYDWYRSPHVTSYSRASVAHNTLLVGKSGQRTDDITAAGKIERFAATELFDLAETEAASAYPSGRRGSLRDEMSEPQPLLTSFRRHFLFCRPNCFVIWDHIDMGDHPSPLTWMLHSLDAPTLDTASSTATVRHGQAAVVVGAFGPPKLGWQTDSKFPKGPAPPAAGSETPVQWHTSLSAGGKAKTADLLLILAPFQGETAPTVKAAQVTGGIGGEAAAEWGKLLALVRVGEAAVSCGDLAAEAAWLVARLGDSGPQSLFADGLKLLKRADKPLLTSTLPCLVSGTLGDKPSLTFELSDKATVTVALAAQPGRVRVDGQEQPAQWAAGVLTVELGSGRHEVRVE